MNSRFSFYILLLLSVSSVVLAQKEERVVDLRGSWKFCIGDDKRFSSVNYNDEAWDVIKAPGAWENQGYQGYDGYAWYRKSFYISSDDHGKDLVLKLGWIDDVDETFLNGIPIGHTGSFPPAYATAYDKYRAYTIPTAYLKFNEQNIICIRVYDDELQGGITGGSPGIFATSERPIPDFDLSGSWKFTTTDNPNYTQLNFNDSEWRELLVPRKWEEQGVDYDGVAWYRKVFTLPANLKDQELVLMLGKIDDVDEVYVNGKMIGHTGKIANPPTSTNFDNYYQMFRGYFIPANLLNFNGKNVIAIRVYDGMLDGGIYEGPIGLINSRKYVYFWRTQKKKKGFLEWFWE